MKALWGDRWWARMLSTIFVDMLGFAALTHNVSS
jgi:hypothetical protein